MFWQHIFRLNQDPQRHTAALYIRFKYMFDKCSLLLEKMSKKESFNWKEEASWITEKEKKKNMCKGGEKNWKRMKVNERKELGKKKEREMEKRRQHKTN